ncbi:MAG: class I SAM-dependent methyltransferase [Candidatus Aenigmarchaeota archaeon]|nr:class I SAM-dependent methyltransferase [Candidatus Aenigmarchaeota archaeon]
MLKFKPYTQESFFEKIPDLETKTLLDVGAGPYCDYICEYMNNLISKNKFSDDELKRFKQNTIAVDINYPKKIVFFKKRCICADAMTLPFKDESFDIVSIGWLLDYFSEENKETDNTKINNILEETYRMLKPEGYLMGDVLLYPNKSFNKLSTIPNILGSIPVYMQQINGFSNTFEKNGFKIKEKAIGYNKKIVPKSTAFYFITQKV